MFPPNNQEEKENCTITPQTRLQIFKQVFYYVKKNLNKKCKIKGRNKG